MGWRRGCHGLRVCTQLVLASFYGLLDLICIIFLLLITQLCRAETLATVEKLYEQGVFDYLVGSYFFNLIMPNGLLNYNQCLVSLRFKIKSLVSCQLLVLYTVCGNRNRIQHLNYGRINHPLTALMLFNYWIIAVLWSWLSTTLPSNAVHLSLAWLLSFCSRKWSLSKRSFTCWYFKGKRFVWTCSYCSWFACIWRQ